MSDVGERLREAQRRAEAELSPEERLRLAFELGRRDLEVFAEANGLTLREARRRLRVLAQAGRTPSRVMGEQG